MEKNTEKKRGNHFNARLPRKQYSLEFGLYICSILGRMRSQFAFCRTLRNASTFPFIEETTFILFHSCAIVRCFVNEIKYTKQLKTHLLELYKKYFCILTVRFIMHVANSISDTWLYSIPFQCFLLTSFPHAYPTIVQLYNCFFFSFFGKFNEKMKGRE